MEEYLGSISVPAIAAAVLLIVKLISRAVGENEKFERFVPLMSAGLGVIFGVVCFYAVPAIIPATNVVVAIFIGGASGFTAIGAEQMVKTMGKKTDKAKPDEAAEITKATETTETTEKDGEQDGEADKREEGKRDEKEEQANVSDASDEK